MSFLVKVIPEMAINAVVVKDVVYRGIWMMFSATQ
jgi:hypothetical protein